MIHRPLCLAAIFAVTAAAFAGMPPGQDSGKTSALATHSTGPKRAACDVSGLRSGSGQRRQTML
jgi:hypothetical protein